MLPLLLLRVIRPGRGPGQGPRGLRLAPLDDNDGCWTVVVVRCVVVTGEDYILTTSLYSLPDSIAYCFCEAVRPIFRMYYS